MLKNEKPDCETIWLFYEPGKTPLFLIFGLFLSLISIKKKHYDIF